MKTLFANNETKIIDNYYFDILTSEELALLKGGKAVDVYVGP